MRKMMKWILLALFCSSMGIATAAEMNELRLQQTVQSREWLRPAQSQRRIATTRRRRGRRHGKHSRKSMHKWMRRSWHNLWQRNWNRLENRMYP